MKQKQIIITGGYSGIGLELSRLLIKDGHKLGLIIKNEDRKTAFLHNHPEFINLNVEFFIADLSNQNQVLKVAEEISNRWEAIDILFNNAGILTGSLCFSEHQNEMHFEVNTIAPYLLTLELKSALEKSGDSIVLNTVTDGLHYLKVFDSNELLNPTRFIKLFGSYTLSKMALLLLMNELATEWSQHNIRFINASPGGNKTKLTNGDGMPGWMRPLILLLYKKPTFGAKQLYDAAFKASFSDKTGIYVQTGKIEKIQISIKDSQRQEILSKISKK
jgi:NAD(P)-dependent dehydrogenase (short-subunit alcohol dehydrogenase family)